MAMIAETAGEPANTTEMSSEDLKALYLDALTLVERLHRRLLDVIKDEFDRMGRSDVNSVQALLLFNIGDAELTAGELRSRGYYLGSNVSYNLKKLVDAGYIHHQRSRVDRRSVRVSLTEKGQAVATIVNDLYNRHINSIEKVGGVPRTISTCSIVLCRDSNGSGQTRFSTASDCFFLGDRGQKPGFGRVFFVRIPVRLLPRHAIAIL